METYKVEVPEKQNIEEGGYSIKVGNEEELSLSGNQAVKMVEKIIIAKQKIRQPLSWAYSEVHKHIVVIVGGPYRGTKYIGMPLYEIISNDHNAVRYLGTVWDNNLRESQHKHFQGICTSKTVQEWYAENGEKLGVPDFG